MAPAQETSETMKTQNRFFNGRPGKRWLWMMVAFLAVGLMGANGASSTADAHGWSPFGFWHDPDYSMGERIALLLNVVIAVAGLGYALMLIQQVWAADTGTPHMQEIARAVREGAMAYLKRQFTAIFFLILIITGVLIYTANPETEAGWHIPWGRGVAFLMGSIFSALVGFTGMYLATDGNLRVAAAARESFGKALQIGYRTGTITGMLTDGLGLLGGSLIFLYFGEKAYEALLGFGFGGTLLALFMRVGGGIYTKAADVGADLVGKIEANIPEDDPRNAATIADNVGDNVGDCAGMAADIFESYEVTIVAAMILGYASFGHKGVIFPLLVRAIGVIGSIISTYSVRTGDTGDVKVAMRAVNRGFWLGSAISIVGFMALGFVYLKFDNHYVVNQAVERGLYKKDAFCRALEIPTWENWYQSAKQQATGTKDREQHIHFKFTPGIPYVPPPPPPVDVNAMKGMAFPGFPNIGGKGKKAGAKDQDKGQEEQAQEEKETKLKQAKEKEGGAEKDAKAPTSKMAAGKPVTIDIPVTTQTKPLEDAWREAVVKVWRAIGREKQQSVAKNSVVFLLALQLVPVWDETNPYAIGGADMRPALTCFIGIILAVLLNFCTEYWTGTEYSPVKSLAKSCRTGHATNIIQGIAVGYESTVWAIIIIAAAILGSVVIYQGTGSPVFVAFGVAMCGIGMLTLTGNTISMDVFGPVADNANGIGEMGYNRDSNNQELKEGDPEYMPPEEYKRSRQILADLDAVGNTTKAITKGIAIGSAVIAAVSLFASFIAVMATSSEEGINRLTTPEFLAEAAKLTVADPYVFIGMLIGGAVPFLFSSMTIRAVGRAAYLIVQECRTQFKDEAIWAGVKKPDYGRVVDICTSTAQKELVGPGLLAIFTPVLIGFTMGPMALGGFLAGMILAGQLLAVFMANSGGAWDNAKKTIEDQPKTSLTGKGSETHKASVTGDTVGDPLKDTAGPAINPLIKVMNMVSLLALPLVIKFNLKDNMATEWVIGLSVSGVALLAVAWSWWQSKRETSQMRQMDEEFNRAAEAAQVG
jgi:Na+/H+-translocating membrane pyrophosphatase